MGGSECFIAVDPNGYNWFGENLLDIAALVTLSDWFVQRYRKK